MLRRARLAFLLAFASTGYAGPGLDYVGAKVCGSCHPKEFAIQSQSNHARTLRRARSFPWAELIPVPAGPVEAGGARYNLSTRGGLGFLVRRDEETREVPVDWIFGANDQGMTFLSRLDDRTYLENRLSFYRKPGKLDITAGQSERAPASLTEALGLHLTAADASRCFGCHVTTMERSLTGGPDYDSVAAGVTCERCHGPGGAHVAAVRAGAPDRKIRNPGKLPGEELVGMCGECHRTEPPPGKDPDDPIVTRFQPVGLQMSACFLASNGRLQCLTCHNPHENARRVDNVFYEQRCLSCHGRGAKAVCRVNSATGCVGCHMPKISPLAHLQFSDHWIRTPDARGHR